MSVKPIVLPITYKSDPKGLRKAQDDLKGFARGIQKAVTGATLAVAGIGAASLKSFADFDAAMNQSLAIMGDVSDALRNEMSDAAREVAKTTTFSAKEAAESYFFLASAGLDAEQSIAALPKVAAFAQAGMFDMAQATDLLTDAQSALGLSSDDAAENLENMSGLADVLVKANTLANASVEQFASALTNKAAASMRTLSMDMEEGVAVLAVFADQGLKGEAAGTAFNATMIGLTKTARTNASAYDALGVSVFDSTGELRNMSDIVADLERGLDGMSTEQVDATLASLGLTRQALDGTKALLGNSDAIREYEEELRNAGGTVDEVAGKQLDTLAAQFDLLKSKIVDVGLEIGGQLEPIFKDLVQEMGPVIDEIADALVPAFEEVIVFVAEIVKELPALINALTPLLPVITQVASVVFGVVAQLLPAFIAVLNILLPIIESLTSFLSNNVEVVTAALVGIGSLVAIIKTWNTVVGIAKLAMAAFNAVLAMNPIGLIVLAVAALTAGLVWFFTQTEVGKQVWATFVEFFKMLIAGMVEFFNGMVENFRIQWENIVNFFSMLWEGFSAFFTAIGEVIVGAFFAAGEFLMGAWEGVTGFLSETWETFKNFFIELWESAQEMFDQGLSAVGDFFKTAINFYIELWEGFINFFIGGINKIIEGLNRIRFTVPDWVEGIGGKSIGINIPLIPRVSLPRLAEGGIVKARPGGIIANIGEGRYDEAVVPLKPGMGLGNTYNITVNAGVGTNGPEVGEAIVRAIKKYERNSGPVFASA